MDKTTQPPGWISFRDHVGKGNRPRQHIRPAAPEPPPMPIWTLCREERLGERFEQAWDPNPTAAGLKKTLEVACPGLQVLHYPGEPWAVHLNPLPAPALISSPDRRQLGPLAAGAISAGAEYVALFADMQQLAGRKRWADLYSAHRPSRVYVLSEAWTSVPLQRAGAAGAWRPACWIVWDGGGKGQPIAARPPAACELLWIPDSSHL